MFLTVWFASIFSSARRPLGAAYVPILLSEVEQEQRTSGNGDREAIVVGAALCDGEDERAYTVYDPILGEEKYLIYFERFARAKFGYGTLCRNPNFRTWRTICRKLFGKLSLSQFPANCLSANCPVVKLGKWRKAYNLLQYYHNISHLSL